MKDVIHKPNTEVFFSFMTLFTWYEFCIDCISDDVKKSHAEYVDWEKIRELTPYQLPWEKPITFWSSDGP